VGVDVHETLRDTEHVERVERGDLDLAFTLLPIPAGPFEVRVVHRDPWVLVVQAGSDLAARMSEPPGLEALAEVPLVCFRAPRAMGAVPATFRAAGIEPSVVSRSDYNDAVQELAAAGRGVALLPRLCVNSRDERTEIVQLGGIFPPREIALAWHRDRLQSEAVAAFVSLAEEVGARLEAEERGSARLAPAPLRGTSSAGSPKRADSRSPLEAPERTSDGSSESTP
jgi:DNA-binding transcriptional LysR family regulator